MTTQTKPDRAEFLAYTVVAAVEGGINYWAEIKDYQWREDDNGRMTTASASVRAERGEWRELTPETIEAGIAKLKTGEVEINKTVLSWIVTGDALNDATDIDATAADCIVQVALFGELVYG